MISDKLQNKFAQVTGSYLDGGWFGKANSLNIFHDLWIKLKGLQKGATGIGNGPLLPLLLQVVHKDIVILLSMEKHNTNMNIVAGWKGKVIPNHTTMLHKDKCAMCLAVVYV